MIVIDTETTGVDPEKHAIVSIGAVEFEDPSNEFYGECRIFEGAHIMEEAMEVNGFSEDEVTDESKQSLESLMRKFLKWGREVDEHTLAGLHIGYFDMHFLEHSAHRCGLDWYFAKRSLDLHSLVMMHAPQHGKRLPKENKRSAVDSHFIQQYVGIPTVPKPHNALTDAKWEAEAVSRLIYDQSLLGEYADHPIPWQE